MLTMWQGWTNRSIWALAMTWSPKISPHSSKLLLLVSTVDAVQPRRGRLRGRYRCLPRPRHRWRRRGHADQEAQHGLLLLVGWRTALRCSRRCLGAPARVLHRPRRPSPPPCVVVRRSAGRSPRVAGAHELVRRPLERAALRAPQHRLVDLARQLEVLVGEAASSMVLELDDDPPP